MLPFLLFIAANAVGQVSPAPASNVVEFKKHLSSPPAAFVLSFTRKQILGAPSATNRTITVKGVQLTTIGTPPTNSYFHALWQSNDFILVESASPDARTAFSKTHQDTSELRGGRYGDESWEKGGYPNTIAIDKVETVFPKHEIFIREVAQFGLPPIVPGTLKWEENAFSALVTILSPEPGAGMKLAKKEISGTIETNQWGQVQAVHYKYSDAASTYNLLYSYATNLVLSYAPSAYKKSSTNKGVRRDIAEFAILDFHHLEEPVFASAFDVRGRIDRAVVALNFLERGRRVEQTSLKKTVLHTPAAEFKKSRRPWIIVVLIATLGAPFATLLISDRWKKNKLTKGIK